MFQGTKPPKSESTLQERTTSLGPKRIVHFSRGTLRYVQILERKGASKGVTQHSEPHDRSPYAPKFEDGSEEETLQQERCARRDAWEMAGSVHKLKEKNKATFHSLSAVWSLPEPSSMKPKEREFVVDSGASMHMQSRIDLNSTELENVRVSRNPTTAITAKGEVQTNEEATVYVYDLDLSVTVQILEDTIAVLSLGKLCCEDYRYSYEWASGQKPHLIRNGRKSDATMKTVVVPGSSAGSSSSTTSTSPTSSPQDTTDDSSSSPATTRRRRTSSSSLGSQSRDPTETRNK